MKRAAAIIKIHQLLLTASAGWPAVEILQKALKEGEQAEIVMDQDPIGSVLQQRAQAGKRWTDAAKNLMQDLKVGTQQYMPPCAAGRRLQCCCQAL